MSFLKYQEEQQLRRGNGRGPLAFHRAGVDGAPFRGEPPLLREEEYDELTEEVRDCDFGVFDVRDEADRVRLREVLDRVANEWYRLVDYDKQWVDRHDGTKTVLVYAVWVVPFRELDKGRLAAVTPTVVPVVP